MEPHDQGRPIAPIVTRGASARLTYPLMPVRASLTIAHATQRRTFAPSRQRSVIWHMPDLDHLYFEDSYFLGLTVSGKRLRLRVLFA